MPGRWRSWPTIGVRVGFAPARALFTRAGCESRDDGRVRIPAGLVEWALRAAPVRGRGIRPVGRARVQAGDRRRRHALRHRRHQPVLPGPADGRGRPVHARAHGLMRAAGRRADGHGCRLHHRGAPGPPAGDGRPLRDPRHGRQHRPNPWSSSSPRPPRSSPPWTCSKRSAGTSPRSRSSSRISIPSRRS